jgi:hypothetical protein
MGWAVQGTSTCMTGPAFDAIRLASSILSWVIRELQTAHRGSAAGSSHRLVEVSRGCLWAKPNYLNICIHKIIYRHFTLISIFLAQLSLGKRWMLTLQTHLHSVQKPSASQPLPLVIEKAGGKRACSASPSANPSQRQTRSKQRI